MDAQRPVWIFEDLARQSREARRFGNCARSRQQVRSAKHSESQRARSTRFARPVARRRHVSVVVERPAAQAPRQAVQFDIFLPPGTYFFASRLSRQSFAISADGRRLWLYCGGANGTNIWIATLLRTEMHAVPGYRRAAWSEVFWPPDSRSIFFSVKRTLKQANLENGSGRTVAELNSHAQLGSWRPNGDLLLYLGRGDNFELRAEDGVFESWRPITVCGGRNFCRVAIVSSM